MPTRILTLLAAVIAAVVIGAGVAVLTSAPSSPPCVTQWYDGGCYEYGLPVPAGFVFLATPTVNTTRFLIHVGPLGGTLVGAWEARAEACAFVLSTHESVAQSLTCGTSAASSGAFHEDLPPGSAAAANSTTQYEWEIVFCAAAPTSIMVTQTIEVL